MKLKQLRCVLTVVESDFNATAAASKLHISQPAVSKQIKLVEEYLGFPIFRRNNKNFVGLTELGEALLPDIENIMASVGNILSLSKRNAPPAAPELTIATTNTLANCRLAPLVPEFQQNFPQIPLNIVEGSNVQIMQMVQEREADWAWFSTANLSAYTAVLRGLYYLPASSWSAVLLLPREHPLAREALPGLEALAEQPLITYITSQREPSALASAMQRLGLSPRVVLTARNADLIKNYVRQGLGLGVIADMAYDPAVDGDLVMQPLAQWLPPYQTYLAWHQDLRLRRHHYALMERILPDGSREHIDAYLRASAAQEEGWVI